MHLYIAIPAMNEIEHLEQTLNSLKQQTETDFTVYVCVNQPENYREDHLRTHIYLNNQQLLVALKKYQGINLKLIDRSSPGYGWTGKQHGVGMARKVLMDDITQTASNEDLIISLDADTLLPPEYLESIKKAFKTNPAALGLSAPYYHPLTGDSDLDRAILRYEIYMRHYLLNLLRINSPYAFSALGSALAVTVRSYKKIGGMTPKLSGEDFYFLQKIKKCGTLLIDLPCPVYPAARYSDRVFFGTGPALIKGATGDWESYPIYDSELFDLIQKVYLSFAELFLNEKMTTPMDDFLKNIFKETEIWQPLRKNNKSAANFIKACHEKLDGLRILQFVKEQNRFSLKSDEEKLTAFLRKYYPDQTELQQILPLSNFSKAPTEQLNLIRDFLFEQEKSERKRIRQLV